MPRLWADSVDEHRILVRRRLVDAFVELLDEGPMEDVTVSAVAARAGLARSAVYNYVDHVHDLVLLHAEEMIEEWLAPLRDAPIDPPAAGRAAGPAESGASSSQPSTSSSFDRLDRLVVTSFEVFATDRLGGMDLTGHLDEERSAKLFGLLAPIMAHMHQIVADGVASGEFVDEDPSELTQFTWAAIGGHRSMLGSGATDPAAAAAVTSRMLHRALVADA